MFPSLNYMGRISYCNDTDILPCESADEGSHENTVPSHENADVSDDCSSMNTGEYIQDENVDELRKHYDAEYVNGEYVRYVNLIVNKLEGLCNKKGESNTMPTSNCYMENPSKGEAGCKWT
jgi:hypothetical protein